MAVAKSQVISVSLEPHIKAALQSVANQKMHSLANKVEVDVVDYCRTQGYPMDAVFDDTLPNINLRGSTQHA